MEVQVTRAAAIMRNLEPLTVGMSKAVPVKLTMSADWDGLSKTAIFKAGTTQIDVTDAEWVDATTVFVPPEVLTKAGSRVQFGLYGTDSDDAIVIPTIWVNLGKVQPAPDPSGDPTVDPTLPVWAQIQGQMVDDAEVVDGDLIITLHNGTELNAGYVIGPQGAQGIQGPQGPAGIGAEIIDFAATLTDWDTMDAASTDVPFADIVQKVQDGAVSARLALTVDGTTYNVNLQGFSVGNAVSFYGIGQIPETLRIIALLGAEGYWFAATETLGGGTSDYDQLSNRPQINGVTLTGNQSAADLGLGTYSKPSGGIPASDLASAVQTSLGKADTAYQKPSGGIPASDLASGVIPTVPSAATANPENLGTKAVGTSTKYAREDHVHQMPSASDVGAVAAPSSPSAGDVLTYNGSAWGAAAPAKEVFVCVYNSTTSAEIEAAYQAGKICVVTYNSKIFQLVYRGSATSHTFACFVDSSATTGQHVSCSSDSWTAATAHELLRAPSSPSVGDFLVYTANGWAAQTLAVWQGGSY